MINNRNAIVLFPVTNGWVIQMPIIYREENIEAKLMGLGRKLQEEQMADPLLRKLQGDPIPNEVIPASTLEDHIKDPGTYIFPTLDEALSFIKKQVTEPPVLQKRGSGGMDYGIIG